MSGNLDTIINVVIAQSTSAVPQPSFSVPLIIGPNGPRVLTYYTDAASMLLDGFTTGHAEYKYAVKAFSQALAPEGVYVGKRTTHVKQIVTIAVNALTEGHEYVVTVNGVVMAYTALGGGAQEDVLAGLLAEIEAEFGATVVTGAVTGTAGSALLTLTAGTFGEAVTYTAVDTKLTKLQTVASNGIVDDMALIMADPLGNNWYGACLCTNDVTDILQLAAFIETLDKIFIAATGDAAVDTSATTDVASVLQSLGYKRTALMYSPGSYNLGIDAGWLGGQLPQVPGASTWKFKNIVGISADLLGASSRARLIGVPGVNTGKGVNIYEEVGGVAITEEGWMVGGQFIDVTIGIDYLKSIIQTSIYTVLSQSAKVPYTDKGVALVEAEVRKCLQQVSDAPGGTGFLDSTTIELIVKPVSEIATASRAARVLPANSVAFTARLAGALHFIVINGTVTV